MTLYAIFNFDAGIINSPWCEWYRAYFQWGRDALDANSFRNLDWALETRVVASDSLRNEGTELWWPFLVPTQDKIDLFFFESEQEDMRLRTGSGKTRTIAALSLPVDLLNIWRAEASNLNQKWDPRLVWCIGLQCEPFTLRPSRSVPAGRPIADCWMHHIAADAAELTMLQLHYDYSQLPPNWGECEKTVLYSRTLRTSDQ